MAILAQLVLYLALRHLATAYMPSWAHHHHASAALPWPALVSTDIVPGHGAGGVAATVAAPPLTPPTLSPPPEVPLAVPDLTVAPRETGDGRPG